MISNSSDHEGVRMNSINDKIVLPLRLMQEKMARKKEILEDISLGSFAITEHFKCVLAWDNYWNNGAEFILIVCLVLFVYDMYIFD